MRACRRFCDCLRLQLSASDFVCESDERFLSPARLPFRHSRVLKNIREIAKFLKGRSLCEGI
jgi:hypothetical protein